MPIKCQLRCPLLEIVRLAIHRGHEVRAHAKTRESPCSAMIASPLADADAGEDRLARKERGRTFA